MESKTKPELWLHPRRKELAALSLSERFWRLVDKSDVDGCWVWVGNKIKGYGRVVVKGRRYKAHILSYELHSGPVSSGLVVCHTCDNPACVRPDHLWLGTHTQNIADRHAKGRTARGKQISNTVKLDEQKVFEMRLIWKQKKEAGEVKRFQFNTEKLGRMFGVTGTMAGLIVNGRFWKHVPMP
jgi:hypothetical protein